MLFSGSPRQGEVCLEYLFQAELGKHPFSLFLVSVRTQCLKCVRGVIPERVKELPPLITGSLQINSD